MKGSPGQGETSPGGERIHGEKIKKGPEGTFTKGLKKKGNGSGGITSQGKGGGARRRPLLRQSTKMMGNFSKKKKQQEGAGKNPGQASKSWGRGGESNSGGTDQGGERSANQQKGFSEKRRKAPLNREERLSRKEKLVKGVPKWENPESPGLTDSRGKKARVPSKWVGGTSQEF